MKFCKILKNIDFLLILTFQYLYEFLSSENDYGMKNILNFQTFQNILKKGPVTPTTHPNLQIKSWKFKIFQDYSSTSKTHWFWRFQAKWTSDSKSTWNFRPESSVKIDFRWICLGFIWFFCFLLDFSSLKRQKLINFEGFRPNGHQIRNLHEISVRNHQSKLIFDGFLVNYVIFDWFWSFLWFFKIFRQQNVKN